MPARPGAIPGVTVRWVMPTAVKPFRRITISLIGVALLVLAGACTNSKSQSSAGSTSTTGQTRKSRSGAPKRSVVFKGGEGDIDSFRIPAVGVTPKGTVVVVAEARTQSPLDTDPHYLVSKRSTDGGRTWGSITTVARENKPEKGCFPSNPVLLAPASGEAAGDVIVVFNACRTGGGLSQVRSTDDGASWSNPLPLDVAATAAVPAASLGHLRSGPGHGIQLTAGPAKGRLVMVADSSIIGAPTVLTVLLSGDGGTTWKIGASTKVGTGGALVPDESAVAQLPDGTLLVSSRGASAASSGRIQMKVSADGERVIPGPDGQDLTNVADLKLPGVEGSLLAISDKKVVVFSSPSDPKFRRGLRLWTSTQGATWKPGPLPIPGPAAYSDLARLDDSTIAVVVETGGRNPYQQIDFVPVPITSLDTEGPALPPDFDVAGAVAGRLVVGKARYPVTRFCLISKTVELDGGQIEVDISGGLTAVKVQVRLDGAHGAKPMTLSGTIALDLTAGITYRGPLTDSSGVTHDVDLVIVNAEPCPS